MVNRRLGEECKLLRHFCLGFDSCLIIKIGKCLHKDLANHRVWSQFQFLSGHNWIFCLFCQYWSYLVFLQFEFLSFVTISVFEFCHHVICLVLSQFHLLSLVTIFFIIFNFFLFLDHSNCFLPNFCCTKSLSDIFFSSIFLCYKYFWS